VPYAMENAHVEFKVALHRICADCTATEANFEHC